MKMNVLITGKELRLGLEKQLCLRIEQKEVMSIAAAAGSLFYGPGFDGSV